jgi:carbonic anhydrase/acetyltransferase-like protein (isoleucine patch superfamily)
MLLKYKNYSPSISDKAFIAPSSTVIGRCKIDEDSSVWFNTVIRADVNEIIIGKGVNIQDGTVVHCDHNYPVHIADNVTIGHKAIVHGCKIGSNCIIGMGSTILDGAVIGDNCIVGANSLVTSGKHMPAGTLIMGSPAKVIRELTADEIEGIKESVAGYVKLSKEYMETSNEE